VTLTSYGSATKKAAGAVCLIAALGLGVIALSVEPALHGPSSWKGYRVLLVDAAIPEAEILADLKDAGIENVLSESTEPVLVSDWAGTETMSLASARARLSPGDPRLDAYLQRLGLWFEARAGGIAYRAYYIRTESSAFVETGFEKKVSGELGRFKGRFVLADAGEPAPARRDGALQFVFTIALLLVAAATSPLIGKTSSSLSALFARKPGGMTLDRFALRLSLILPWAVFASGGHFAAALAALWALAFAGIADMLDIPLDEFRNGGGPSAVIGSLKRQGLPPLALPATALLALIVSPGSILSVSVACLGSLTAAAGYALISMGADARKRFIPMPIGRFTGRRRLSIAEMTRGFLACVVVVVWGLGSFILRPGLSIASASIVYPTPAAARGSARPLIAEARSRFPAEAGSTLPGIASYLEHRAFQEAVAFVPMGEERADPFAPASMPLPDGKAQTLTFDDEWARQAYASLPPISIESMLLAQGQATVGRAGGALADVARSGRPLAPIKYLLYIFLLVPPIARLFRGVPLARGVPSGELRQEA
jgi:hypothetical protein